MIFNDTCDVGNIAFDSRQSTEDVAYVGRFDEQLSRWRRTPVGDDLSVVKLAVAMLLARHSPRSVRKH